MPSLVQSSSDEDIAVDRSKLTIFQVSSHEDGYNHGITRERFLAHVGMTLEKLVMVQGRFPTLTEREILELREVFSMFDINNDGCIDKAELRDVLDEDCDDPVLGSVTRLLAHADNNGNEKIEFEGKSIVLYPIHMSISVLTCLCIVHQCVGIHMLT